MKPVNVNAQDILGDRPAASTIAFGAACAYAAAGTIKGAINNTASEENYIGIAVDDNVEKDEDGFYSQYDMVSLVTAGRCRVWVTPDTLNASIKAGDYLSIKPLGHTTTNTCSSGVFSEGGGDGAVRRIEDSARALEDVTLTSAANYIIAGGALAIGGSTVTVADSSKFTIGDYILLEDLDGNVMVNRVKAIPSDTTFTLQIASTVALESGVDYIHILAQCEVMLL